jgi:hypothetical protein
VRKAVGAVRLLIRIVFVIQLLLGVALWTGRFDSVRPLHIALGVAIVLGLWTQAVFGWRAGAPPAQVAVAIAWGALTPIFGLTQEQIASGGLHWVVQVIHLAVGVAAVAQAEALATRVLTPDRVTAS